MVDFFLPFGVRLLFLFVRDAVDVLQEVGCASPWQSEQQGVGGHRRSCATYGKGAKARWDATANGR